MTPDDLEFEDLEKLMSADPVDADSIAGWLLRRLDRVIPKFVEERDDVIQRTLLKYFADDWARLRHALISTGSMRKLAAYLYATAKREVSLIRRRANKDRDLHEKLRKGFQQLSQTVGPAVSDATYEQDLARLDAAYCDEVLRNIVSDQDGQLAGPRPIANMAYWQRHLRGKPIATYIRETLGFDQQVIERATKRINHAIHKVSEEIGRAMVAASQHETTWWIYRDELGLEEMSE